MPTRKSVPHPRRRSAPGALFVWATFLALLAPGLPAAALVRVPADATTLEQAIREVRDGEVIELAAGTYRPQNTRGFRIEDLRKGFTIRAAAGATVTFDGGGSRPLLDFDNASRDKGGTVVFERIVFANGKTAEQNGGGAATLRQADAVFFACTFVGNEASLTGGAALIAEGSQAVFVDSDFRDNSAPLRGGALSLTESSTAYVIGSRFFGNRVNRPQHRDNASGGAIGLVDARLRVYDSVFEGNQAGWTGGAIYAYGNWPTDPQLPSSDLLVAGSRFLANEIAPDACCQPPGATFGGAIHIENQTTLRIDTSVFRDNRAERGGALSLHRAELEVRHSVFDGNRVPATSDLARVGADLNVDSADFADSSTNYGAINRRSASVLFEDTAFLPGNRGTSGRPDNAGCVRISGDSNRQFGDVVPRAGTLADNRAKAIFRRTLFEGCGAYSAGAPTQGGALLAVLADVTVEDSVFLGSRVDDAGFGGALAASVQSAVRITGSTFAGSQAGKGAAIWASGSELVVDESTFLGNEVSPGTAESVQQSFGTAIFSQPVASGDPLRAAAVSGEIRDNRFVDERGLALWEVDLDGGPPNELQYGDNRFFGGTFGDRVFVNILGGRAGSTPAELDALTIQRGDGTATTKSLATNLALATRPVFAQLRAVPGVLLAAPAGEQGRVTWSWSGSSATLGGSALADRWGSNARTVAGPLGLTVNGQTSATATVAAASCTDGLRLCLAADRFLLDLDWQSTDRRRGIARTLQLTSDTGAFWFFRDSNLELLTKILDGSGSNGHHWVFAGSLTNLGYTLRAVDRATGLLRTWSNPLRTQASLADTSAFPAALHDNLAPALAEVGFANRSPRPGVTPSDSNATCIPSATALCLVGGRIRAEMTWTSGGRSGQAQTRPLSGDTGAFWFFRQENLEILVKMLDGRSVNGHFWLFYGALSNVEYTLTLTDTVTGQRATYRNPRGTLTSASDTEALPGG